MYTDFTHGDVLIARINKLPVDGLTELNTPVIQEGEHTGHAHRIHSGEFKLFRHTDGTMFLEVSTPITIKHEEHNAGVVPEGFYKIGICKEYDYESQELRNVLD